MHSASEKLAITRLVEDSELSVRRTLVELKVSRSSFYRWYRAYERDGLEGLENHSRASRQHWNKIPESVRDQVVEIALDQTEMTQGKIERYHRSMKNVVKLENYYYPWELEKAITDWVQHYNHERYHESLDNVTPVDVYHGRQEEILVQRAIIKSRTMNQRKVQNLRLAG